MKTSIRLLMLAGLVGMLALGCRATQQKTAYNTIASVQATAAAVFDGYADAVIKGVVKTNDLPAVAMRYNQLRMACAVAATSAEAGTNALAPAVLTAELLKLTELIGTVVPAK